MKQLVAFGIAVVGIVLIVLNLVNVSAANKRTETVIQAAYERDSLTIEVANIVIDGAIFDMNLNMLKLYHSNSKHIIDQNSMDSLSMRVRQESKSRLKRLLK